MTKCTVRAISPDTYNNRLRCEKIIPEVTNNPKKISL